MRSRGAGRCRVPDPGGLPNGRARFYNAHDTGEGDKHGRSGRDEDEFQR